MVFLHILLLILKWIGIVLAGLLALVLLLVLIILFVPLRYKVQGRKDDEVTEAQAKVTWLLHLVRFTVDWNGGKNIAMKLKVLWFTLMDKSGTDEEEEGPDADLTDEEFEEQLNEAFEQNEKVENGEKTETETTVNTSVTEEETQNESQDKPQQSAEVQQEQASTLQENTAEIQTSAESSDETQKTETQNETEPSPKDSEEKDKNDFDEQQDSLYDKIVNILEKPFRLLESLSNKKAVVEEFFEDRKNKAGIELTKKILFKLLKAIAPKRGKGSVTFGTGDPATTGYALAGASILYVQLKGKLKVVPDFENKVFTGEGYIKGRIYIITLLVLFCKLWFNKNFKALKSSAKTLKDRVKEA